MIPVPIIEEVEVHSDGSMTVWIKKDCPTCAMHLETVPGYSLVGLQVEPK